MKGSFLHLPVLLNEVMDHLDPGPGDVVLDATLGGGGHAIEVLKRITPGGRLIAVEKDPEAIERTKGRLEGFRENVTYVNDDFRNIDLILDRLGVSGLSGAVFDLGISSFQVDDPRRGFSFLKDGPLDMRFDTAQKLTARDVIGRAGGEELADIIREYGEERHAKLIARAICAAREKGPITTTAELAGIIIRAAGGKYGKQKINPAARTFQAIRICVNDELAAVKEGVGKALDRLEPGGKICVISFHSLEDRIVKVLFKEASRGGRARIITRKPVTPGEEEVGSNPRSRSAKLRVAEKI